MESSVPKRSAEQDAKDVGALDLAFQAAVKRNDADAIDAILHPQYFLVLGDGAIVTRNELIGDAREGLSNFEIQDEDPGTQTVRVGRHGGGDGTAVDQGR